MQTTPTVDWAEAQAAVAAAGARASALVRSIRRPDALALGEWTVRDVAAHLSHAVDGVMAMAKGAGGVLGDIWELPSLTGALVRGESEKDVTVLADRIDASVEHFLRYMQAAGEDTARVWFLPSIAVPLSLSTCHVLNELTMHGRDIAVAEGVPWPIARSDARLILVGFLFPIIGALGSGLVDQETAGDVRATFGVHLRGGGAAVLALDKGSLTVTQSDRTGRVDCHLSVDPTAFLLVAWGRVGQWGPIAKGQLVAYGRKPWLGPKFRGYLRNP